MRVLIADGSQAVAERLTTMLAEFPGIVIAYASTVQEALGAVGSFRPDAVLLDLQLPGGRGIDVLRDIRRERSSSIVIVFTNHSHPQYRKKCLENGAHFFIDKSTEFRKLNAILKELVCAANQ